MSIKNLLTTGALTFVTLQIMAAEKDEMLLENRQSAATPLLKEAPATPLKPLQLTSDQKQVRREIKKIAAMVGSFISKPDGRLPWEMRETYADHLLGLTLLYLDVKDGKVRDVSATLRELEDSREEKLFNIALKKPSHALASQTIEGAPQQEGTEIEAAKPPSPILEILSMPDEIAVY